MPEELNKKIVETPSETQPELRPEPTIDNVVPEAVRNDVNRHIEDRLIQVGGDIRRDGNGVPVTEESNAPLYKKHENTSELPVAAQSPELSASNPVDSEVSKKVANVLKGEEDISTLEGISPDRLVNILLDPDSEKTK